MRRAALALLVIFAASDADAFDCAKAKSPSEKAICADSGARAADEEMAKAYGDLLRGSGEKSKKQLAAAQANWLRLRDGSCSEQHGEKLAACLTQQSRQRAAFLAGRAEAGPGTVDTLAAKVWYAKLAKGQVDVDYELLEFAAPKTPGERAFNAAVERLQEDGKALVGDAGEEGAATFGVSMRLVYASPRLVSAHADIYQDGGGAHPNESTRNFNFDIQRDRLLSFADGFAAEGANKIAVFCYDAVLKQKRERLGDDAPKGADELAELNKSVSESIRDLGRWSFGPDKAVIAFDRYTVGAYAEGDYECALGYETLRPWAKAEFPLP